MSIDSEKSLEETSTTENKMFDDEYEDIEFPEEYGSDSEESDDEKNISSSNENINKSKDNEPAIIQTEFGASYYINIDPSEKEEEIVSVIKENIDEFYPGHNKNVTTESIDMTDLQYKYFSRLDFENIAKLISHMNVPTRLRLLIDLQNHNIDISSVMNKKNEKVFTFAYSGLFSSTADYHAWILNWAISDKNWQNVFIILMLKDRHMMENIKKIYMNNYYASLEDEIEREFPDHYKLMICALNENNYEKVLAINEYQPECQRILEFILQEKYLELVVAIFVYHPKSYKELAQQFYLKYAYTIIDFLRVKKAPIAVFQCCNILCFAMSSPLFFYCWLIRRYDKFPDDSQFFPYILITLLDNGLDYISEEYKSLYPKFYLKNIDMKYTDTEKPFIMEILRKYF